MTLLNSTSVQKVDSLVCEIIDLLESNFLTRIRGYYMMGSLLTTVQLPQASLIQTVDVGRVAKALDCKSRSTTCRA